MFLAVERDEFGQRDRREAVPDPRRELFQDRQRFWKILGQRFVQADGGLAHALHDAELVEVGHSELHEALAVEIRPDGFGFPSEMPETLAVENLLQRRGGPRRT